MPLSKNDFLEDLYQIELKRLALNELSKERIQKESDLSIEYKIDEANSKRAAIVQDISSKQKTIQDEINIILDDMAEKART